MRDVDIIDQELRLLAAVRMSTRELGGTPGTELVDELLDERTAIKTEEPADQGSPHAKPPPTPDC